MNIHARKKTLWLRDNVSDMLCSEYDLTKKEVKSFERIEKNLNTLISKM